MVVALALALPEPACLENIAATSLMALFGTRDTDDFAFSLLDDVRVWTRHGRIGLGTESQGSGEWGGEGVGWSNVPDEGLEPSHRPRCKRPPLSSWASRAN